MNPTETASKPRRTRRLILILGAIAVFVALVVIGQMTTNDPAGPGAQAPATPDTGTQVLPDDEAASADSPLARRDPEDPLAMGDIDAPVVLIEWTDLRCPFCAAFSRDSLPAIVEEYVDAGLVRIEVHDVAYFGEQSVDAAVAARAAANQGMFFEYVEVVYGDAPDNGHPDMPREKLIAFAEAAGIPDIAKFTADLDDPALEAAVRESTSLSQQIGVSAVPFFVAGDAALSGAYPVDIFRDYLDEAVGKTE